MVAVTSTAATDTTDAAPMPTATVLILVLLPMLLLLLLYNYVAATNALVHAPVLAAVHTPSSTDTISDASDATAMLLILSSSMVTGITKWHEAAPLSE